MPTRPLTAVILLALLPLPATATPPPDKGIRPPGSLVRRIRSGPPVERGYKRWVEDTRRARDRVVGRERITGQLQPRQGTFIQGVRRIPVVTVTFSNTAAPPYDVALLANQLFDGPSGTLTQLYQEMSYGYLTVQGKVYGWVGLKHDDKHYEDGDNGLTDKLGDLLQEAFSGVDEAVDFGEYDNDGPDGVPNSGDDDGFVDFIAVVHPERGAECGGRSAGNIWSHRYRYRRLKRENFETNDEAKSGGKIRIDDYVITPARACGGPMVEIGVFAHEFGHAFGLPDFYDTSATAKTEGIGVWGLMGAGNWNSPSRPAHMSAWEKAFLGWVYFKEIRETTKGLRIPPVEVRPDGEEFGVAYQVFPKGEVGEEYFVLENRQAIGFDDRVRCRGLLVWHVDETQLNDRLDTNSVQVGAHKALDLEEADGRGDLDSMANRGDASDCFPGAGKVELFSDATNPDARLLSGEPSGVSVQVVGREGTTLIVDVTVAKGAVAPPPDGGAAPKPDGGGTPKPDGGTPPPPDGGPPPDPGASPPPGDTGTSAPGPGPQPPPTCCAHCAMAGGLSAELALLPLLLVGWAAWRRRVRGRR